MTFSSDFTYTLEVTYPIYDITLSGAGLIGRKLNDGRYVKVDYGECSSTQKKTAKGTWCYIRGESGAIQFGLQRILIGNIELRTTQIGCYVYFNAPCVNLKKTNGDSVYTSWDGRETLNLVYPEKYFDSSCSEN